MQLIRELKFLWGIIRAVYSRPLHETTIVRQHEDGHVTLHAKEDEE